MEALQPFGPLCHLLYRGSRQVLPSYTTQRAREKGCTTFIVSQHLWFPCRPTPAWGKGMRLPSCPRAPAWPGSVLLATCRGMTLRRAGEIVGTTVLSPGRSWALKQEELGPHPLPHIFWTSVSTVCGAGKWGSEVGQGTAPGGNAGMWVEGGASPRWKRKEMGLAQQPSGEAYVKLTEMGRSQLRRGQEG